MLYCLKDIRTIPMSFLKNKLLMAGLLSGGTFVLFCFLIYGQYLKVFQLKLSNYLYQPSKTSDQIVIVAIDEKSLDAVRGLGAFPDWKRSYYARVLNNINKYKPKVVGFDIFFRAAKSGPGDQQFAQALKETKAPVLIYQTNERPEYNNMFFFYDKSMQRNLPLFGGLENVTQALNKVLSDEDDVIRGLLAGIYDMAEGRFDESFAVAIARKALGAAPVFQHGNFSSAYPLPIPENPSFHIPLEDGQMLIRYFSTPRDSAFRFPKISFADVFHENYSKDPKKLFQDKIVLIGGTASYFNDYAPVPGNSELQMYGVEIHANAIQTILEQKFLRNLTFFERIALIAVLCVGAGFVFMMAKIHWSLIFLLLTALLYMIAAPFAFERGLILDVIHPYLALVFLFIATYVYRYEIEFREKKLLKTAFAKYVNPKIVSQIVANPEILKLGGQKCEVTVLFTDIAHFTSISENLQPESIVALLNEYFTAMSQVILAENGTLDKFEGDGIMAFFGAPLLQPDHALRACRAALNMRKQLSALLQKWENDPPLPGGETKPALNFRCGLNSGEVIVGNVGSFERFDYTVMGDTVNLGSRLEGANKKYGTSIMLSENTYAQVKDSVEVRALDIIQVIGKVQPIQVYELLAEKGELTEKAMQMLCIYHQALACYRQQQFEAALRGFQQVLEISPNDAPARLYAGRCKIFLHTPPDPGWDGVFKLDSK